MKFRGIFFIALLISVFLVGCLDQPDELPLQTYQLSAETFESFYEIQTAITEEEGIFTLAVELIENYDFEVTTGRLTLNVFYAYERNNNTFIYQLEHRFILETSLTHAFEISNIENLEVEYLHVVSASGLISSNADITETIKTYSPPEVIIDDSLIQDLEENIKNYEDLKSQLLAFEQVQTNQLTLISYLEQTYHFSNGSTAAESSTTVLAAVEDPFYYHVETDTVNFIINEHNGKLYYYQYGADNYVNYRYQVVPTLIDTSFLDQFEYEDEIADTEIDFDPTKVLVIKDQSAYIIRARLYDVLSTEEITDLEALYRSVELSTDLLAQIIVEVHYNFYENKLEITTVFTMQFHVEMVEAIEMKILVVISYEDVTPVNPRNSGLFLILHPTTFDDVDTETNFLTPTYNSQEPVNHKYYGYLEAGLYDFDNEESNLNFRIYSENRQLVPTLPHVEPGIKDKIYIAQSGYYFIDISWSSTSARSGYQFRLKPSTLSDYTESPVIINGPGTYVIDVESAEDLVKIAYQSTGNAVLSLEFITPDSSTRFYSEISTDNYSFSSYLNGQQHLYGARSGTTYFYVSSNVQTTLEITVEVTPIGTQYFATNFNNMQTITQNGFATDIYYGGGLQTANVKLIVPEQRYYTFEIYNVYNSGFASLKRQVATNEYTYAGTVTQYSDGFLLEPGNYVLSFESSWLNRANIRYTYQEVVMHQEETITLKHFENLPNNVTELEKHETMLFDWDYTKTYTFTLNQNEQVFIYGDNLYLYDGDTLLSFHRSTSNFTLNHIFYLSAGTYQLIQYRRTTAEYHQTYIGIIDEVLNDDNPYYEALITNTDTITLSVDHAYDTEYIKWVVTEAGNYTIDVDSTVSVYDKDFALFNSGFAGARYYEVGTYYIFVDHHPSSSAVEKTVSVTRN